MFGLFSKGTSKVMNINDIDQLPKNAELIDIREPSELRSGSLKSAKNIPMDMLLSSPEQYLKQDTTYYIFCQSGARSSRTASYLSRQGYDIVNLSGGIGSYVGTMRK